MSNFSKLSSMSLRMIENALVGGANHLNEYYLLRVLCFSDRGLASLFEYWTKSYKIKALGMTN